MLIRQQGSSVLTKLSEFYINNNDIDGFNKLTGFVNEHIDVEEFFKFHNSGVNSSIEFSNNLITINDDVSAKKRSKVNIADFFNEVNYRYNNTEQSLICSNGRANTYFFTMFGLLALYNKTDDPTWVPMVTDFAKKCLDKLFAKNVDPDKKKALLLPILSIFYENGNTLDHNQNIINLLMDQLFSNKDYVDKIVEVFEEEFRKEKFEKVEC